MKSSSVCLIFFLVLFTISGDCRVTVNEDPHSREIPWKCVPEACDKVCKVEEGSLNSGYCRDKQPVGCFCKIDKDYIIEWQCVPATCDQLCKAQEGAAATGFCRGIISKCFCKTSTAGY